MTDPSQRYYTPWQILAAAVIGSALAAGYLTSRNYFLFSAPSKANATLLVSIVVLVALGTIAYILPKGPTDTGIA
jgi:hypothetical protein